MADEYYDAIADGYDELYGEEQERKLKLIKTRLKINSKTKILDIGCGTGISTNFNCFCIGIDPSENLISIAKKKNYSVKHKYIVDCAENIEKMGFKQDEFDYVLCISAVHHINYLDKFLKIISRISREQVFTVLNKISKKEKIINTIKEHLNIKSIIEEEKDVVLFCGK
ncbi:MAG: class I SAM-dependent methyltransferase [Candidatus Woesearchaeota archaeon]